jgi:peptidoglycan/LPS O-acetylase OafA/YrhL
MAVSPQTFGGSSSLEALEIEKPSPSPPIINSSARSPELDGLRGLAILLVLFYHAVFELQPSSKLLSHAIVVGRLAWSGVDLFFVLSGFLIGGILLDVRTSPRYFKTFYFRRAYRILPLYFVALALFSVRYLHGAAGPLGNFSHSELPWLSYLTFTQNIWVAMLGTFGAGAMAATWSLAVEEQFYLTAPFLVRKISHEKLARVLLAVIGSAPLLRTALYFTIRHPGIADYVLMPCRADALSLGMLVAWAIRTPRCWNFILAHRSALKKSAWILLAAVVVLTPFGDPREGPSVTIGYSLLALFYTSVLLLTVTGNGLMQRTLRSRILMRLGSVSYFTYLFHLPLMEAMRRVIGLRFAYASEATQFLGGWLGIGVTLGLAALSLRYFEKPLLRIGQTHRY